ncbi:MAG: hypothetical protein P1U77_13075 [Rubripirellula sp.]|nr:hypothetical protein [Rubripirellula sp.]
MISQTRTPQVDAAPGHGKSRITGAIIFTAIAAITVMANLPYQIASLDGRWYGGVEVSGRREPSEYITAPVMAGWPLNYQIRYPDAGQFQYRRFSIANLVLNLALGVGAATLGFWFVQWRHRRLTLPHGKWLKRWTLDAGIALAILFVPGAIIAGHYWQFRQHMNLASEVARYGNTYLSCWVPEPIVAYVPEGMKKLMSRVRRVSIVSFDGREEAERKVCEIPTLIGMSVLRDGIRKESIESLQRNFHFSQLTLSRARLETELANSIGKLPWLVDLVLRGTNIDSAILAEFSELPLLSVDLQQTGLALSDLGQPAWSQSVVSLQLSRPVSGQSDQLVIDGWPNLRSLSVTRFVIQENESPLGIELINLPALESLRIDRMQKHQLKLRHVPRLATIDSGIGQFGYMLDSDDFVPGQTWVSALEIEDTPSLRELAFFARDLESISVRDAPNLREFALGSYLVTLLGAQRPLPVDPDRCQQWIELIGSQNGPSTVDLQTLPLSELDLSPLAKNQRIRHLNLNGCGVRFEQLQTLAGMTQLETLNIRASQLEEDELAWLLDRFEQLEVLEVDGFDLTNMDLNESLRLKRLTISQLNHLDKLRLINVPELRTRLRLMHAPQQMEIENALALTGLSLENEPWPKDAEVTGLRDVEWFAAGGPAVDDALLDVLLDCRLMDSLTLAYGSLSKEKLKRIGEFSKLRMLSLPGANIDDEVTKDWGDLSALLDVNLDDTSIGAATIGQLSRIEPLRRVSLRRVALDELSINGLAEMTNLSQLILAGVPVTPEQLQKLFRLPELESLDISGMPFDESFVDFVKQSKVKHLVIRQSGVEPSVLMKLLAAKPLLFVDMGPIPDSVDDQVLADLKQRAFAVQSDFRRGWQSVFPVSGSVSDGMSASRSMYGLVVGEGPRALATLQMPRSMGRIDIDPFRPDGLITDEPVK